MKVQTITLEIRNLGFGLADDPVSLESVALRLVASLGYQSLHSHFYHFHPQGVTGIILLSESHLAIHSWPEKKYLQCTLVSCKPIGEAERRQIQQIFRELSSSQTWQELVTEF